jgi:hypothetical protein
MGIKDQTRRIVSGAGFAIATTGLSSCNDSGAVDPPPPPLECNAVNAGQTLSATATLSGDTVDVRIRNDHSWALWRVERVVAVSGATILETRVPGADRRDPLDVKLRLDGPATTQASFTVEATMTDYRGDTCAVQRTFDITIADGGVRVTLTDVDPLPLAARQRAEIVLAGRRENVVELHARTPWRGPQDVSWSVTEGELDADRGPIVHWTLPSTPGIYQAELVIDFGNAGLALDMLLLEVL